MLKKAGYKEYKLGDKINPHDKLYFNNRGKALFIVKAGSAERIKEGVRILVAHVDSPRLDLKQVPLYEKERTCIFENALLRRHQKVSMAHDSSCVTRRRSESGRHENQH
ncbi:MAG: hypothetical protein L6V79_05720 [Clostridium sp.]|nr:MAG: hypothetical protein L6V79_05720 [Clostridium sp.]